MHEVINLLEALFNHIPLSLLEVWGRLGYLIGFALMLCAYGGITFRAGGRWALGSTSQSWNSRALIAAIFTFAIIFLTGYIGSSIVLVPGAQTFESLKDLSVFLCIVLFGYPALLVAPFAYGLSDLVEGVPPAFLGDWLFGYFINPACFWLAHQLIGRDPDFRRARTWGWYALFVLAFMAIEPLLWGYITSPQFTPELAYRSVTPALAHCQSGWPKRRSCTWQGSSAQNMPQRRASGSASSMAKGASSQVIRVVNASAGVTLR